MPSVFKRGKKWRVQWREGGRGSKQRVASFNSKTEASEAAEEIAARLEAMKPAPGRAVMTLAELATRWLNQRSQAYRDKDERAITRMLESNDWTRPRDVNRDDMASLTVGQWRMMRAILRYGASLGQSVDPGALMYKRPRKAKTFDPVLLTDAQVAEAQRLADEWGPTHGLAVHILSTYGHRPASLVAAPCDALDGSTFRLVVKGRRRHQHPMLPATIERWRAATGDRTGPLLLNRSGDGPWSSPGAFTSWYYHQIGKQAHPDEAGVYNLKRYAITRMLGIGMPPEQIASITGHLTISQILTYARINEERQQAAIGKLKGLVLPGVT